MYKCFSCLILMVMLIVFTISSPTEKLDEEKVKFNQTELGTDFKNVNSKPKGCMNSSSSHQLKGDDSELTTNKNPTSPELKEDDSELKINKNPSNHQLKESDFELNNKNHSSHPLKESDFELTSNKNHSSHQLKEDNTELTTSKNPSSYQLLQEDDSEPAINKNPSSHQLKETDSEQTTYKTPSSHQLKKDDSKPKNTKNTYLNSFREENRLKNRSNSNRDDDSQMVLPMRNVNPYNEDESFGEEKSHIGKTNRENETEFQRQHLLDTLEGRLPNHDNEGEFLLKQLDMIEKRRFHFKEENRLKSQTNSGRDEDSQMNEGLTYFGEEKMRMGETNQDNEREFQRQQLGTLEGRLRRFREGAMRRSETNQDNEREFQRQQLGTLEGRLRRFREGRMQLKATRNKDSVGEFCELCQLREYWSMIGENRNIEDVYFRDSK